MASALYIPYVNTFTYVSHWKSRVTQIDPIAKFYYRSIENVIYMETVKLAFTSYFHFSFSCKILKLNGSDYREVFLAYYIQHNFTSPFPSSIF